MPTVKMTPEEVEKYAQMAVERGGTASRVRGWTRDAFEHGSKRAPDGQSKRRQRKDLVDPEFIPPATWVIPLYVFHNESHTQTRQARLGRSQHEKRPVHIHLAKHYSKLTRYVSAMWAGCTIRCTLTRTGPRKMDYGNMVGSLKYVQDAIADRFGVDDGDKRWDWKYTGAVGPKFGVTITFEFAE